MNAPLTLEEVKALAASIGLNTLSRQHLEQLQKVTNAKRSQDLTVLSRGLSAADEPACTFSLGSG